MADIFNGQIKVKMPELTPVREAWINYYLWLHDIRDANLLVKALKIRRSLTEKERKELSEMSAGQF